MAVRQSLNRTWCRLTWLAVVLLLAGGLLKEASARSFGMRRLQQGFSECPHSPMEHCDFYFQGFEDELPVINLDGTADAVAGAPLLDAVSNQYAQVLSTDEAMFLCPHPGANGGPEFYFAANDANRLRFHNLAGNKTHYENSCFVVPLLEVEVTKDDDSLLKLVWGDENQLTYPDVRRCIVFTTSPNGYPAGGTCVGRR